VLRISHRSGFLEAEIFVPFVNRMANDRVIEHLDFLSIIHFA